ncbi:MAG: hypothetical protein R3240_11090, partial [Gammaproteobacteria bacterium]|nr:hypothetical protein [Gammaproteobacteria bacterium]
MNKLPELAIFDNQKQFTWIVNNHDSNQCCTETLISYYNPARPAFIQVISEQEQQYLTQLSDDEILVQLKNLAEQQVKFIIFDATAAVLPVFSQQDRINILQSPMQSEHLINYLSKVFAPSCLPATIFQGGLVIVDNQGLLVSGKSGSGKSQLLIKLIDRGHLWVADELTHCYLDYTGQLMGKAVGELDAFAHIKQIGPINIDKTFGLSRRLKQCPIAGIIHLGENNTLNNKQLPAYSQRGIEHILGHALPV